MNPSRIARCRDLVDNAGAKSEILIKADDLQAVVEAAELALVLELKQQGADALTAMSEERFWQGLCLRFTDLALEWPEEADRIVAEYLKRYGEKPEQPTATVVAAIKRPEFTTSAPEGVVFGDPKPGITAVSQGEPGITAVSQTGEPTAAAEPQEEPRPNIGGYNDPRPWVQDFDVSPTWHYFPNGHREPAACGIGTIPGSPYVSESMPSEGVCSTCAAEVVEPQPERKGLEWTFRVDRWTALSQRQTVNGLPCHWRITTTVDGEFRDISDSQLPGYATPLCTLTLAQARCQRREDEIFAQQAAEQEDVQP